MADSIVSKGTYPIRASILAQTTRKDYLEKLVEESELLESLHGSDYPHEISRMLQDMLREETISDFSN
jgi:hypothetical protein